MNEHDKKVRDSFDKISKIPNKLWNHNNHYYKRALDLIARKNAAVLDIGCGDGDFLSLAKKRGHVCTGVDFSSGMIEEANKNAEAEGCTFICGDIYEELPKFPGGGFDAAFSFAAMHHLDYEKLLLPLSRVMKKGGFFCVVDIRQSSAPLDYIYDGAAFLPNIIKKRIIRRGAWQTEESRRLWDEHGELDTYMKITEIKRVMDNMNYSYKLRRLLYFRYMLVIYF